jgi:hypothetical protein
MAPLGIEGEDKSKTCFAEITADWIHIACHVVASHIVTEASHIVTEVIVTEASYRNGRYQLYNGSLISQTPLTWHPKSFDTPQISHAKIRGLKTKNPVIDLLSMKHIVSVTGGHGWPDYNGLSMLREIKSLFLLMAFDRYS